MTLPIEYSELLTLILAIFAFVGIMRGWYKEGITSIFAVALAILVWKPVIAAEVIDKVNDVVKLLVMFVKAGFSLDPSKVVAQTVPPDYLIDPDSYRLYVVLTAVLIIASYLIGEATIKDKTTPLGRLLGGLLGLFNGFLIVSVVKQYLMMGIKAQVQTQAVGPSDQLSLQLIDVPTANFFAGYGIIFVFVVLVAVIALLIAGDRLRLPLR